MKAATMTALRKGKLAYIRQPKLDEFKYIAELWADYETMKDVGGNIVFEQSRWNSWYEKMIEPGDGKNFYCLIFNRNNKPVGEVSFHRYNRETGSAELNIKVQHEHRSKGYGKEAVLMLLDYFYNEFGGEEIRDAIAINNKNGQNMLMQMGFEHNFSDNEVFMVKMTKEKYNSI